MYRLCSKVKHVGVLIVNLAQVGSICIHGGVLLLEPATLLKVALLQAHFSRFLNCVNGTKSLKASQLVLAGFFYC